MTQKKTNDQLTQTSFKKIILLDSKTSSTNHFDIDTLDSNEIFIVCINPQHHSYSFNFNVHEDSKLKVLFYGLSSIDNKNFEFNFNHLKNSNLLFISRLFVNNQSKITLNTNVSISKDASNIISDQQVQGYLFSDESSISATPALLVNTNNINASHSVNIGYFDPNKIFYLQTKGFDKNSAIEMLINNEISQLKGIDNEQNYIYNIVHKTIKEML